MPFDANRFRAADYAPRTESIPVPVLADFFGSEKDAVWTVRGLGANELFQTFESSKNQKDIDDILTAIETNESKAQQLRDVIGIAKDSSKTFAAKLEALIIASVDPVVERDIALLVAQRHPTEFVALTTAINRLTGQGMSLKKSHGSGKEPT